MKQQYVLIFAKTSHSKTPYDQWLCGTGITPLIVTSVEFANSYRHLQYVRSFSNYDQNHLVEKAAFELAEEFKPIAVFARAEADVLRAARLREKLGIQGQGSASALAYRNKIEMKNHLKNSGLELPRYQAIHSPLDILEFTKNEGFPVVVKPTAESGSYGTTILRSEDDVVKYFAKPYRGESEVETFVDGEMYHVDGLIQNGEIKFIWPSKYVNDCLSFRKNEFLGGYFLSLNNPVYERLIEATRVALNALPVARNMAFHAELWQTPDNRIVFCEIASRTGGAVISSAIDQKFGFNIDREWLLAECGLSRPFDLMSQNANGWVVIPPQNGFLESLPSGLPSFVCHSQYCGDIGQRFHGGVKSGLFLAGYVVRGSTESETKSNIVATAKWFSENTKWQYPKDLS